MTAKDLNIAIQADLIDWLDKLAADARVSRRIVVELILMRAREAGWNITDA